MSEAQDQIRSALAKLDVKNDDHWTENGLPRLDALGIKGLNRQDITGAAPQFTRANAVVPPSEELKVQPVAAPVANTDQADFDALQLECDAAEKAFGDARAQAQEAKAAMEALGTRRDALLKRLEKARPKDENMLGIRAVLNRGQETRAARAELANQLKAVGVTASLLQAGSPLDRAMSRKRGFGLNRPTVPGQAAAGAGAK